MVTTSSSGEYVDTKNGFSQRCSGDTPYFRSFGVDLWPSALRSVSDQLRCGCRRCGRNLPDQAKNSLFSNPALNGEAQQTHYAAWLFCLFLCVGGVSLPHVLGTGMAQRQKQRGDSESCH
jgi:hypothetical protein